MNLQCFASFVFLYFAVLTPIITFGGLLGDATDNNIAVVESLVGACIAGILFHMFAGQPLTIIGSTGPILIFERISFAMTIKLGLDYLEFRQRLILSRHFVFYKSLKYLDIHKSKKDNGSAFGQELFVY